MLFPYLVLIQLTDKTIRLLPVAAENGEQAIAVAGHICVQNALADAIILAVFTEEDIARAAALLEDTKKMIQQEADLP